MEQQKHVTIWIGRQRLRLLQLFVVLFLLLNDSGTLSGTLLAAPGIQQPPPEPTQTTAPEMVYGLVGLPAPNREEPANVLLYTDEAIHPVVGATPAIDERLLWLSTQEPPPKVKVWGRWIGTAGAAQTRQLVVTGLVVVDVVQRADRAFVIGEFAGVNLRSRPDPYAPSVGQIRQGESYPIVGRDARDLWWQICCLNGESAWVQQQLVTVAGDPDGVPVVDPSGVTPGATPTTVGPETAVTATLPAPIITTPVVPYPLIPTPQVATPPLWRTGTPGVPTPPLVMTTPTPVVLTAAAPFWQATYFAGTALAGPSVATEVVPDIDFDWNAGAPVPQLPADSFSARFEQRVPLVAGFYALRAQADDGVRVYVNDELVIDEWHSAEPTAYRAGLQLSGPTTFRVEYYEDGGQASLRFDYELVDDFPAWRAAYYDNISLAGRPAWVQPEERGVNAALSHQWSLASPVPDLIPENNWSARWTGTFAFEGGDYRFLAEANDGVRVWIDGIQVIEQWQDGSNQAQTIFEDIGPGAHEITVEYYERGGIANVKVDWTRLVPPE